MPVLTFRPATRLLLSHARRFEQKVTKETKSKSRAYPFCLLRQDEQDGQEKAKDAGDLKFQSHPVKPQPNNLAFVLAKAGENCVDLNTLFPSFPCVPMDFSSAGLRNVCAGRCPCSGSNRLIEAFP